jgi:hypothetical protein
MTKADALEKRIKRNVTAREHTFFVVVSPGLVKVCRDELVQLLGPDRPVVEVDGGIEFKGTVSDAYRANLYLRTASRIIMRFGEFTATDFPTLEKKIKNIPWELYLGKNHIPSIHVTAKKSRLNHTGALTSDSGKVLPGGWMKPVFYPAIQKNRVLSRTCSCVCSTTGLSYPWTVQEIFFTCGVSKHRVAKLPCERPLPPDY